MAMAVLTKGNSKQWSSHWYTRTGDSAHRQEKRDGGDRATTITDARKLRLLPSVTNILGVLGKPALDAWKLEQALKAALANPKREEESFDYWKGRVLDQAFEQVDDAAARGTKIHAALDAAFDGEAVPAEFQQYVQPVLEWLRAHGIEVIAREQRIVSTINGYAGTADVLCTVTGTSGTKHPGLLDYKTKKTKPGESVCSYFEHKAQLSAYAAAYYGASTLPRVVAANIFISTTEPGRVEVVRHEDVVEYHEAFLAAAHLWRIQKEYDPRD